MISFHLKYYHQKGETQNKRTLRERPVAESATLSDTCSSSLRLRVRCLAYSATGRLQFLGVNQRRGESMTFEEFDSVKRDVFSQFKGERSELIPILQATQHVLGYLPTEAMQEIAAFVSMPDSQVYGVATFYSQFYFSRRGKHQTKVCSGTACHVKGAARVLDTFQRELGIKCGMTSEDFEHSLETVACVGSCALAPVVVIDEKVYGQIDPGKISGILEKVIEN
jgi:NADH-quinone oxidoreductase subunit E